MSSDVPTPATFGVAIVARNQDLARLHRKALSQLRYGRVACFASGHEALEFLLRHEVGLAIADHELDDMVGIDFIKLLKRDSKTRAVPVVMVTAISRKDDVLDAISAGCSGYVLRPYSLGTLEKHLSLAREMARFTEIESEQLASAQELIQAGDFDAAIDELEEILTVKDEAQRYFDMGTRYLMEQKYGKAIIAYNKAVKLNDLFAEAYKGLADAHKGKGNMGKYQEFLHKAAEVYAQQDRLQETKDIFSEILKTDTSAINPYNSLGVRLRKKGDYAGALHAYRQALEITPNDENLLYNISKACQFAGELDTARQHLLHALDLNPDFTEGKDLYQKITGEPWQGPTPGSQPRSAASHPASTMLKDD